jgi:energy-coupling factor transport system substrate-specific component
MHSGASQPRPQAWGQSRVQSWRRRLKQAWAKSIGWLSLAAISTLGVVAFIGPLWSPTAIVTDIVTDSAGVAGEARLAEAPLLIALITGACLLVAFANLGPSLSSKSIALIGVLVGINALLRLLDISFFIPGEFSPIFLLITLVGYCFGSQFGFLMGALTLLVSALITGGVGPWLPFQMIAAGWVGMTASWLRLLPLMRPSDREAAPRRGVVLVLAAFGFIWGFGYGVLLTLYTWPFLTGGGWQTGMSPGETLRVYLIYYLAQSFAFDLVRAVGNAALMLALGTPLLGVFLRFRQRFSYYIHQPGEHPGTAGVTQRPDQR